MPQFGQPMRSAQEDANAGVVNPPSVKRVARQVAVPTEKQQVNTSLSEGLQSFGETLGGVLQERLNEETENINEQRALDATVRQSTSKAINEVDKTKKRTGWTKGIFGENVEYRAAQQRAVENAVNAEYLKQATEIDKHAGETQEEYATRLSTGLNTLLAPYQEDKETKALATKMWLTASAKLSAKQYQSNYAYNQDQQRKTTEQRIQQTFDTWSVEGSNLGSPEEARQLLSEAKQFFSGVTKPEGMDDIAWRGAVNNQLQNSLRKGNIGAYRAAKDAGWINNLSATERVSMDRALNAYDTDFTSRVATVVETSELAAIESTTLEKASVVYQDAKAAIDTLEQRASGSDRGKEVVARARKRLAQTYRRAFDSAKTGEAKQKKLDTLIDATRIKDPIEKSKALSEITYTKNEYKDALDVSIVEDISKLVGSEQTLDKSEALEHFFTNPQIARHISSRLQNQETQSPFIQNAVDSYVSGFSAMADENGIVSERGTVALAALSQLERNKANFKNMVGTASYDKYQMVKRGVSLKQTVERIDKELNAYETNKGNRDIYAVNWELGEGESKRDRIQSLVSSWIGQQPQGGSLAHYQEEYDRALTIFQGDRYAAEDYLKTSVESAGINYRNIAIPNSKRLNDVTKYSFGRLLDGVQASNGESASLMTPYLSSLGYHARDKNGKILTDIRQIKGLTMYTVAGTDGFYLDSQEAQQPVFISDIVMKNWERILDQGRHFKQLEEEAAGVTYDAWLEEQEWMAKVNPHVSM